jgi:hypothetical protein
MDVEIKGNQDEVLRRLVAPFFEQGSSPVYVAKCCGRLFAGTEAPKGCRVCELVPAYVGFESLDEVAIAKVPAQPPVREPYRRS